MYRLDLPIKVINKIKYSQSHDKEIHQQETVGTHTVLASFETLTYVDLQGQAVKIKWFKEGQRVQISRMGNLIDLQMGKETTLHYLSDQGRLVMQVETLSCKIVPGKLKVGYRLKIDGKSLAKHEFSLIYGP